MTDYGALFSLGEGALRFTGHKYYARGKFSFFSLTLIVYYHALHTHILLIAYSNIHLNRWILYFEERVPYFFLILSSIDLQKYSSVNWIISSIDMFSEDGAMLFITYGFVLLSATVGEVNVKGVTGRCLYFSHNDLKLLISYFTYWITKGLQGL